MDDGLVLTLTSEVGLADVTVLILVLLDDGLVQVHDGKTIDEVHDVLILVLLDDGLVHGKTIDEVHDGKTSLNPCFVGRWTSTGARR